MKRTLLIGVVLSLFVGATVTYRAKVDTGTINDVEVNLVLARQSLGEGNLPRTDQLLAQLAGELATLDGPYVVPWARSDAKRLAAQDREVRRAFETRCAAVRAAVDDLAALIGRSELDAARERAKAANAAIANEPALLALDRYLARLGEEDFTAAKAAITPLPTLLAPIYDGRTLWSTLDALADAQRAATAARVEAGRAAAAEALHRANMDRQGTLADALAGVVGRGRPQPSSAFRPALRGRAMVWDQTKGAVDPSFDLLAPDLRGGTEDDVITMMIITKREWVEIGRYSISNEPAYQEHVTVAVAYWPERASPGTAEVLGERPPSTRVVEYQPEYGSAVKIKEWIESLPR